MGRIGKPHGVKGWVTVAPSTDEPELRFAPGAQLQVAQGTLVVAESRVQWAPGHAALRGYTDRDRAQALRGRGCMSTSTLRSPTEDDGFYDHQLVGLELALTAPDRNRCRSSPPTGTGRARCGSRFRSTGAGARFVEQFVPLVDPDAGIVHIEPVEGCSGMRLTSSRSSGVLAAAEAVPDRQKRSNAGGLCCPYDLRDFTP